jgi:hypothetical protein
MTRLGIIAEVMTPIGAFRYSITESVYSISPART